MSRPCNALLLTLLLSIMAPDAIAHSVLHRVLDTAGVSVAFHYSGVRLEPVVAGDYVVYRPQETIAFQRGQTDLHGRLAFIPDRAGVWRIELRTPDGHHVPVTVAVDKQGTVPPTTPWGRWLLMASLTLNLAVGAWLYERRRAATG